MLCRTPVFFIRRFSANDPKHKRHITLRNSARTDLTSSQDLSWNNYANVLSVCRTKSHDTSSRSFRPKPRFLLVKFKLVGRNFRPCVQACEHPGTCANSMDRFCETGEKKFTLHGKVQSYRAILQLQLANCNLQFTIKFRVKRFCKSFTHSEKCLVELIEIFVENQTNQNFLINSLLEFLLK